MVYYLIIINENSGKKNGRLIYRNFIEKLGHNYVFINSNSIEFISNLDEIKGIIIIGGDGTIVPIVEFLYKKNYSIPICHLPAGSGNGLCKSILFSKNKKFSIENSIDLFKNNNVGEMDLIEINLKKENKNISCFLSITWGILSDIDINTEWLRYLGEFRFTLGGFWYFLKKNSYFGKLTYLDQFNNLNLVTGNFVYFLAANTTHISSNTYSSPNAKLNDGYINLSYITDENVSRYELFMLLLGLEDGTHIKYLKEVKVKEFKLIPNDGLLVVDGELQKLQELSAKVSEKRQKIYT